MSIPYLETTFKKVLKHEEKYNKSPNQGGFINPQFIILHDACGSWSGSIAWILNDKSDVSYHYLIHTDGSRVQFVHDRKRAWHAGKSTWKGLSDLNTHSVGVAFTGDTRKRATTFEEIDSCAQKCVYLINKFELMQGRKIEDVVLTHEMIAPKRKTDTSPDTYFKVVERIKELM